MDHLSVEIDPDADDSYISHNLVPNGAGSRTSLIMGPIAIEGKLRVLSVRLLYEVCRVQKLSEQDLCRFFFLKVKLVWLNTGIGVFNDSFIDHLFELVEQTRFMPDETFNYSVIKLIVSIATLLLIAINFRPGGAQRTVHGCRLGQSCLASGWPGEST